MLKLAFKTLIFLMFLKFMLSLLKEYSLIYLILVFLIAVFDVYVYIIKKASLKIRLEYEFLKFFICLVLALAFKNFDYFVLYFIGSSIYFYIKLLSVEKYLLKLYTYLLERARV